MNELAFLEMGRPSHVVLSYDRSERLIGLQPNQADASYAFPVRASAAADNNRTWVVSARSFSRYFEIESPTTRRFKLLEQDGVYVIDLKDPIDTLKPRNRRQGVEPRDP